MIVAAIDLGTVTCRLYIAEVEGVIERELVRECRITNLGVGVSQTGMLSDDAIMRVVDCISDYKDLCTAVAIRNGLDELPLCAVATSAARDAQNSSLLVEQLAAIGVNLQIIPGTLEADLSFLGASGQFPGEVLVVVDVGGGSTEVIFGRELTGVEFSRSFDIGCRRITEMFIQNDPPAQSELVAAREYLYEAFSSLLADQVAAQPIDRVIAVAGTATSVVSIDRALEPYDPAIVHKTVVPRQTLDSVLDRLAHLPIEERKKVIGLEPKRAGVIVAGMLILQVVLEVLGKESFTVSESDILQGIALAVSQNSLKRSHHLIIRQ